MVGFNGLAKAVASAPVINGIRVPDDESDLIDHRNGRFINNVFVPDDVAIDLPEFTVNSELTNPTNELVRGGRSLEYNQYNQVEERSLPFDFNFENFYAGRKQDMYDAMALESRTSEVYAKPDETQHYYLQEEPDSLHADRSPYTFEPADTFSRIPQPSSNVIQATNSDFEIKEHSYQMCPGCPTFNIPIPVPKSALYDTEAINPYNQDPAFEYEDTASSSLIDVISNKIISTLTPVLDTARSWFGGNEVDEEEKEETFSDRLSVLPAEKSDLSPVMFASLAAVGLGVATIISSGVQLVSSGALGGRDFPEDPGHGREDDIQNLILPDYDSKDLLCLPRNYCEKMKRNKHLLDEFKNTKRIGLWVIDRIFDKETVYKKGEAPFFNQCNLRECIYSLLA